MAEGPAPTAWNAETRHERPLEDADPGPRPLLPGRLGRPRLRHHRRVERRGQPASAPASTATSTRSRARPSTAGGSSPSTARPARCCGSGWPHTGVPKVKRHIKATHANSTPATDGKHVVAFFGSDGLYCYDVDGKLLWKRDLGVLDSGWFYDPAYQWGFGSSPIIYKDLVIVQSDVQKGSFLAAYDLADGRQVWRTQRDEIPSWATPTVFESAKRAELVTNATKHVRGYDPATGKELWRLAGNSEIVVPTPVAAHGLIYVTSGYPPIQPIYAIKPGAATATSRSPRARRRTSAVAWSKKRGGPYMPTPIVYGDHLYTCSNNGILTVYDAKTGKQVYTRADRGDEEHGLHRLAGGGRRQALLRQRGGRGLRGQGRAEVRAAGHQPDGRGADGDPGDRRRHDPRPRTAPPLRHRRGGAAGTGEARGLTAEPRRGDPAWRRRPGGTPPPHRAVEGNRTGRRRVECDGFPLERRSSSMSRLANDAAPARPLRLWPGIALALLVLLLRFGLPLVAPDQAQLGVFAGLAGGVLIVLWWLLFSRAPWRDRLGGLVVMAAALAGVRLLVDPSISQGAMGFLFYVLALPTMSLAFVAGLLASRGMARAPRRLAVAASLLLGCAVWTVIRTGGFTGNFEHDFHWRWTPTPEERLVAEGGGAAAPAPRAAAPASPASSAAAAPVTAPPRFRGRGYDGDRAGRRSPPMRPQAPGPRQRPRPRRPLPQRPSPKSRLPATGPASAGPAATASSAASASPPTGRRRRRSSSGARRSARAGRRSPSHGDVVYTQEQRGEDELVACYDAATGEPVWMHRDPARFWESNAGAGPRGDADARRRPRLHPRRHRHPQRARRRRRRASSGRATPPTDTERRSSRAGASPPRRWSSATSWSSPPPAGSSAYDAATGKPRWIGPDGGGDGYSSPHLVDHRRRQQILLLSGRRRRRRGAGRRRACSGSTRGRAHAHRAAGRHRRRRRADQRPATGRHAPRRRRARRRRLDRRGALDLERPQALLQRLRRPRGPRLRLRRPHPRLHRPRATASASGRAAATATASWCCCPIRTCCWCSPRKASWRWSGATPDQFTELAASRRSRARPGTTRCSSATCCWSATARRWPRSGWRPRRWRRLVQGRRPNRRKRS